MIIGCDTGFFVEFIAEKQLVTELMDDAAQGEHVLVTSVICVRAS